MCFIFELFAAFKTTAIVLQSIALFKEACDAINFFFNRICAIWPKGLPAWKPRKEPPKWQLPKSKQCKKFIFPQKSNLQPLDYHSTALPLELEKMSPPMLIFDYLDPATCLFYDFNDKSIVMFLMFSCGNPKWTGYLKAAGLILAGSQLFCIACFWVAAVLMALPYAFVLVGFRPNGS